METKEITKLRELLLNKSSSLKDRIHLANNLLQDTKFINSNNELKLKPKPGILDKLDPQKF